MACGVHLGILLICLIKAEHVLCLWAQQAQGQNSNTNIGFSQQGSGFGGSDPQNQLRQASGSRGSSQSSSFNTDPELSSGYSQRFPSSGYTQGVSQPARSGYASVMLAQSSSESKSNWPKTRLSQGNVQKTPKKLFGLSTNIASGSSLSKNSNYRLSSSESLQSPRKSYSFKPASHQSAAQKASRLSSTGAAEPHRIPPRTKTSASAPATRVYLRRSSVASKPYLSLQNERTRNNPSQTQAGNKYPRKPVLVNARNLPASGSRSVVTSGLRFAPTRTHNIPQHFGGSAIRRLKEPADQRKVNVKQQPAYVAPQRPSAYVAPQPAYVAPQWPSAYVAPQRPSAYVAPQPAYVAPQRPSAYVAPQRPSAYVAPQPAYVAPQRPSAYVAPQRPSAYMAPKRTSAAYKLQVQSVHPVARWISS